MNLAYQDSLVKLYHAKTEETIDQIPEVDLLLIDPPFGINVDCQNNNSSKKKAKPKDYKKYDWGKQLVEDEFLDKLIKKANYTIIWGGNYYKLPPSSCWLVWNKETGKMNFADSLLAWTNLPGAVRSITWRWNGMLKQVPEHRFHPTQMPEAVINFCLDQFEAKVKRKPELVLDCYAGSGTTLVSCKKRGIKCIGVEQIEEYVLKAKQRLMQDSLFS